MKQQEKSIEELSAELYCEVSHIVENKTKGLNMSDAKAVTFGIGVTTGVCHTLQVVLSMVEQGYTVEQIADIVKRDIEEISKQ